MSPFASGRSPASFFVLVLLVVGCAGFEQERHVAPLFTELSIAGGEREVEVFGGAVILRTTPEDGKMRYWAVRPLISRSERSPTETFWWIVPPLGSYRSRPEEEVFQFLPVTRFARQFYADAPPTWSLITLPGIYWAKTNDNRIVRAWFPFGGVVEHFLSVDRGKFFLFPLYTKIERSGRTTRHWLWPFFSVSEGAGGPAWRVWPLIGTNRWEGRYERWFVLWPFFHWQHNRVSHSPKNQERAWMVWPLLGHKWRGASDSWTFLWPFFGVTRNTENGFWAWDAPWPSVVVQVPGETDQATRYRFWPVYSYYKGDGLTSRWIWWPFFNHRVEVYPDATKETTYLFPFWHSWDRVDRGRGSSRWRKLFPAFRSYRAEEGNELFFAFPTLNPLWRLQFVDEHFSWMWELYSTHRVEDIVRDRSWLGLYRRERDANEDRRSFVGLWGLRKYWAEGEPVRETSLLFGLVRWRKSGAGRSLLPAAFPGPGWPLERQVRTLPAEEAAPDPR